MFAAVGDTAYDIVLILHILSAIIGFGAVMLNGIYGQQAKARGGREGLAIFQANKLVSTVATYFMYAVFLLGIVLVLLSDDAWDFGQTWIWLAMTIFIVAVAVSHGMLIPRLNRMENLMEELSAGGPPAGGSGPPPQVLEMERLGKQVGIIGPALDLAVVVVLVLMVTKPGV